MYAFRYTAVTTIIYLTKNKLLPNACRKCSIFLISKQLFKWISHLHWATMNTLFTQGERHTLLHALQAVTFGISRKWSCNTSLGEKNLLETSPHWNCQYLANAIWLICLQDTVQKPDSYRKMVKLAQCISTSTEVSDKKITVWSFVSQKQAYENFFSALVIQITLTQRRQNSADWKMCKTFVVLTYKVHIVRVSSADTVQLWNVTNCLKHLSTVQSF